MTTWNVCITRDVTMSGIVEVEADSREEAEDLAWEQRNDVELVHDDCIPRDPYISWSEPEQEEE